MMNCNKNKGDWEELSVSLLLCFDGLCSASDRPSTQRKRRTNLGFSSVVLLVSGAFRRAEAAASRLLLASTLVGLRRWIEHSVSETVFQSSCYQFQGSAQPNPD